MKSWRPWTCRAGRILSPLVVVLALALHTPDARAHADHPGATVPITEAPGLRLEQVGRFAQPTHVTSAPGDTSRLYVVQKQGTIRLVKDGVVQAQRFLDVSDTVLSPRLAEAGLLSMAFAPDYQKSGRFYIAYTQKDRDIRLEEFRRAPGNPDLALRSTRRRVAEIEHSSTNVHYGGQLAFGPDGLLYWGVGDGEGGSGSSGNSQNLDLLLGKILRIDPRRQSSGRPYGIPTDNPFVGRRGRDEVWSFGLRNPWRFSFDDELGALWIGDVGDGAREEIDYSGTRRRGRGENFGWGCFEGSRPNPSGPSWACPPARHTLPLLEYPHRGGGSCSVTGGHVLRDPELPSLWRRYIYGDYCTGALHAVRRQDGRVVEDRSLGLVVPRLTTFGKDAAGHLYVASFNGTVYRLRRSPAG